MMKYISNIILSFVYVTLCIFIIAWGELHHLKLLFVLIISIPLISADIFTHYSPRLIAYLFAHRKRLAYAVLLFMLIIGLILYLQFPLNISYNPFNLIKIVKYIFLGGVVGVIVRILYLKLFSDIIKVKPIVIPKILILLAWAVFFILSPLDISERSFISFYIIGFGLGFFIQYSIQVREIILAQRNRLKENIISILENLNEGDDGISKLPKDEEKAVKLYINQKFKKLDNLLKYNPTSDLLSIIKLSMFRKQHQYEKAVDLINDKLSIFDNPNKHFYHLHYAINEMERYNRGKWLHKNKIYENLNEALRIKPDCLLTNITMAIQLANEIEINSELDYSENKAKAITFIEQALNLYENNQDKHIHSYITGMVIPVTYAYLLEVYAYVLMKCHKFKLSKALLYQCLFQDPTYSLTYLHLAEWHLMYSNSQNLVHISDNLRKSLRVCLYIAIEIESIRGGSKYGTYVFNRSQSHLSHLKKQEKQRNKK